jgi:hypothetical protein
MAPRAIDPAAAGPGREAAGRPPAVNPTRWSPPEAPALGEGLTNTSGSIEPYSLSRCLSVLRTVSG